MLLQQCNLASFKTFCSKSAQKRYGYSNGGEQIFTVVMEVLCNNNQSRNLIGPYHFLGISARNLTSFTRPFLTGRHTRAGHETIRILVHYTRTWLFTVHGLQPSITLNPRPEVHCWNHDKYNVRLALKLFHLRPYLIAIVWHTPVHITIVDKSTIGLAK